MMMEQLSNEFLLDLDYSFFLFIPLYFTVMTSLLMDSTSQSHDKIKKALIILFRLQYTGAEWWYSG